MGSFSIEDEKQFYRWTDYAATLSITLSNIENLRVTMQENFLSSSIDAPNVPNVDITNLRVNMDIAINEITESYIAIKAQIRDLLKTAPHDFQRENRIWLA